MIHRYTFSILVVLSVVIAHRRDVHAGPGGPGDLDAMKDWPRPELRAQLSHSEIAAAIAAYADKLHAAGHFSGVVLAAHAGKTIATHAVGLADVASRTPHTLDTKLNIGSINKLFTKVAIAQLAEAGKLSLDDTLRAHLPACPIAGADKITIGQLLDHRSGLGDIFGPRYDAAPPARLRELDDFVRLFADQPLAFEPGTSERYSNAGYVMLGLVIERVSGETYRDYVARHVFAPAGMTSTGLWAIDDSVAGRATGYTRHGKDRELPAPVPNTDSLPGRPSSAGGAYSTARDLVRFWDALLADKLLSPRWTSWMVNHSFDDARRAPAIIIGGGAHGVNAATALENGWTVVALANLDPPSAFAMAQGAMDIIRGKPGEHPGKKRLSSPASAQGPASLR